MRQPSKIKRYHRLKAIGEGAYGKAFLVKDLYRDGAECVIKTIDVTQMNGRQREACITEVKLLAQLEHPFIVRYLDSFVEDNHLNIVMSHCPDGDLAGVIRARRRSSKPFSEMQIMRWLAQMLMALKHIHSQRIIHRDIKSQNLLVDCDKRLRLADFGISKLLDHATAQAQTFIGTPSYLSPELCLGERYGAATDIWSVGCVVYEIATFKTPFHMANTMPDLFYKINAMPYRDASKKLLDFSESLPYESWQKTLEVLSSTLTNKTLFCVSYLHVRVNKIPPLPARYSADLQALVDFMLQRDPHKRATATQLLQMPPLQEAVKAMLKEARSSTKKSAPGS